MTTCRAPEGAVDTVLSYCHNNLADQTLLDLLPYLHEKGVGVISASFSSMGLLRKEVREVISLNCCLQSLCLQAVFVDVMQTLHYQSVYGKQHVVLSY